VFYVRSCSVAHQLLYASNDRNAALFVIKKNRGVERAVCLVFNGILLYEISRGAVSDFVCLTQESYQIRKWFVRCLS
jgi:hypothetical protein